MRIAWTQGAEVAVSQGHAAELQSGWPHLKKKKKKEKKKKKKERKEEKIEENRNKNTRLIKEECPDLKTKFKEDTGITGGS